MKTTHIRINIETKKKINSLKVDNNESIDNVLIRLIDEHLKNKCYVNNEKALISDIRDIVEIPMEPIVIKDPFIKINHHDEPKKVIIPDNSDDLLVDYFIENAQFEHIERYTYTELEALRNKLQNIKR